MSDFLPTIILRHRKENLNKCSLAGLEKREDFRFFTYPYDQLPPLQGYILLALDAPVLSAQDRSAGLFLIDATWHYAERMYRQLPHPHPFIIRSLPPELRTAYPRKQTGCTDPVRGLASIEALFAAYTLMNRPTEGLLDRFHWKEEFKQNNPSLFSSKEPSFEKRYP